MQQRFFFFLAILATWSLSHSPAANDGPLPPDQAYLYKVEASTDTLYVNWDILPEYYLYRPKISFASKTAGVTLGEADFPKGKMKNDEFFGDTEIYRGQVQIPIPYSNESGAASVMLEIKSQGCADIGLCYPPQTWSTTVALNNARASQPAADNLLQALGADPDFVVGGAEFLPPEEAFQLIAEMADDYTLSVKWLIAEGYYLYKDKFAFTGKSDLAQVGTAVFPQGKTKHDEFFGTVEVFYHNADIRIPISRASPNPGELELTVKLQGCAEDGICYPPMTRTTLVGISAASTDAPITALASDSQSGGSAPVSEQDLLASRISSGSLPLVMLTFFGFGLLLAFTPCVLPMVPILSGIIAGQGKDITAREGFTLSLVYVLAMALTYTIAGVVVALLGKNVQAFFQNPFILGGFSLVFIALSLAMFDVYELQVPSSIQTKLSNISNKQSGGSKIGVGIMGVLSALIVGPCVAAPLVAVLIFIGQSGDAVRGGLTLFALSLGMGAPLLAFGASAGKLMVKAGPWMNTVKRLFGIMLLGVAIWMLARILPPRLIMLLWAALAVGAGVVLGALSKPQRSGGTLAKLAGIAVLAYGGVLAASAAVGGNDPLNPLRGTPWHVEKHLEFELVKTVADLDAAVARANAEGRSVMLDFYADWCVSCKEMEKYTFTADSVHASLGDVVLLQADVTANDSEDQALLKRFGIYGPPTIAFFDTSGAEIQGSRVVGFMNAENFSLHVNYSLNR